MNRLADVVGQAAVGPLKAALAKPSNVVAEGPRHVGAVPAGRARPGEAEGRRDGHAIAGRPRTRDADAGRRCQMGAERSCNWRWRV